MALRASKRDFGRALFSAADFAHASYLYRHPRTLITGDGEGEFNPLAPKDRFRVRDFVVSDPRVDSQEMKRLRDAYSDVLANDDREGFVETARDPIIESRDGYQRQALPPFNRQPLARDFGQTFATKDESDPEREDDQDDGPHGPQRQRWTTMEARQPVLGEARREDIRTLEFDPARDEGAVVPLVQRDKRGRVKFEPGDDGLGHFTRQYPKGLKHNDGWIRADDGTRIPARRNDSSERRVDTNCHGYVFANGDSRMGRCGSNPEMSMRCCSTIVTSRCPDSAVFDPAILSSTATRMTCRCIRPGWSALTLAPVRSL
ncbi:MAG: hypothetical protein K8S25_01445 [Alphaproteobacteria bacterium]|nr:hypothetical protein [Alphaproteobacteria bacterium]